MLGFENFTTMLCKNFHQFLIIMQNWVFWILSFGHVRRGKKKSNLSLFSVENLHGLALYQLNSYFNNNILNLFRAFYTSELQQMDPTLETVINVDVNF